MAPNASIMDYSQSSHSIPFHPISLCSAPVRWDAKIWLWKLSRTPGHRARISSAVSRTLVSAWKLAPLVISNRSTGQLGSHQLKIRKSSEVSSLDCQKVPQLSWSLRCPRCPVSRPAFFSVKLWSFCWMNHHFFIFFLGSVPVKSSTVNISKSCQLQFFLAKSCWIPIFWLELPWNAPRLKRQLFSRTWEERSFSRISWQDDIWSYWKWPSRNSGFTHEKWWFSIAME